jgi:nucleoside-diphosphate-sugar epimerase
MRVLLTGATGYLGQAVGRALLVAGHEVVGMFRNDVGRKTVVAAGMSPVCGDLDYPAALAAVTRDVDAVIETASADNHDAVVELAQLLAGSGKRYVRTSGVGIYSELTAGEPAQRVYAEDSPFTPHEFYAARLRSDELAVAAAAAGVHSVVLRPGMVYGAGGSEHLPVLLQAALRDGVSRFVGRGRNQYGNVYLDDLAAGYVLALERAPAGSVYNLTSGENTIGEIADGVAEVLGLGPTLSVSVEGSVQALGKAYGIGIAVAARADSTKAVTELGWRPYGPTLLEDLTQGSYRRIWGRRIPTVSAS